MAESMNFQFGESVVCVNDAQSNEFLVAGRVYTISSRHRFMVNQIMVKLLGMPNFDWNQDRFRRLTAHEVMLYELEGKHSEL